MKEKGEFLTTCENTKWVFIIYYDHLEREHNKELTFVFSRRDLIEKIEKQIFSYERYKSNLIPNNLSSGDFVKLKEWRATADGILHDNTVVRMSHLSNFLKRIDLIWECSDKNCEDLSLLWEEFENLIASWWPYDDGI